MELPKKYKHIEFEKKWRHFWSINHTYDWDKSIHRENTFAVDTPPPTVSGSLHIGHIFSYTHTDILTRHQRMLGKNIFYPMGWDDNGLPTERRVQNVYGIKCDPTISYHSNLNVTENHQLKPHEFKPISRQNFIEICNELTKKDEAIFEELWRKCGL